MSGAFNLKYTAKRLPIDPAITDWHNQLVQTESERLLARADIIARQRLGNSIQAGDIELAQMESHDRDRLFSWGTLFGTTLVGAGFGGALQNALDGRMFPNVVVCIGFLGLGLALAWASQLRVRRWRRFNAIRD